MKFLWVLQRKRLQKFYVVRNKKNMQMEDMIRCFVYNIEKKERKGNGIVKNAILFK